MRNNPNVARIKTALEKSTEYAADGAPDARAIERSFDRMIAQGAPGVACLWDTASAVADPYSDPYDFAAALTELLEILAVGDPLPSIAAIRSMHHYGEWAHGGDVIEMAIAWDEADVGDPDPWLCLLYTSPSPRD